MKISKLFTAMIIILLSENASAAGLFFEGGIHTGGDTLASVNFTSGQSETIKAGGLLSAAIGTHFDIFDTLQGRISIGYKFDTINASNADLKFSRIPLEFLLLKRIDSWMLGGGITRHLSPKFTVDASALGASGTADFNDSNGIVLAIDYVSHTNTTSQWYLGLRYTGIDYENQYGSVSGNSIGVVIGFLFY